MTDTAQIRPRYNREITPWIFPPVAIAWRLFVTAWLVYSLHFATDVVREHYLAASIGESLTFRVDEYVGLHPDFFEMEDRGWYIMSNPGTSLLAAVPYALMAPAVQAVTNRVMEGRLREGNEPPTFDTPRPNARRFFAEAWRRGLDIKLGLVALITQLLVMAPLTALGVVAVFFALRPVIASDRNALWLALVYAFGTPTFFRAGFLNPNLILGTFGFLGFLALWNPGGWPLSRHQSLLAGGLGAGLGIFVDYSGAVMALGLGIYGLVKHCPRPALRPIVQTGLVFVAGALPPLMVLWFYQHQSFGNFLLPAQHWMPAENWPDGYQGWSYPKLRYLWALAFDYRFGLFVAGPVFLLALLTPFASSFRAHLPRLELTTILALSAGLGLFFASTDYMDLQFNTGIRYLAPIFPFLFLPAATALMRCPVGLRYGIVAGAVTMSWAAAMTRETWFGLGALQPVVTVLVEGFKLPALTTLERVAGGYGGLAAHGTSPLAALAVTALLIAGVWRVGRST